MAKGLWAALAVVLASLGMGGPPARAQGMASGDERILAAREAARTGDAKTLERLANEPSLHVLDPYVRYWLLANKLARPEWPPVDELNEFLVSESGTLLAERLRTDWLRRLAKDQDWTGFLRLYPDLRNPDAELRCHHRYARLLMGAPDVFADLPWLEITDLHAACEPAIRLLAQDGRLSSEDLWWRFRRQVDTRNPGSARAVLAWLPRGEAPALAEFDRVMKAPGSYLDRLPASFAATRGGRELALAALVRLAREDDPRAAQLRFLKIADRLGAKDQAYIYAVLGHYAALSRLPQAVDWYRAAGAVPMTPEQRAWRVRAALRAEDWRMVLAAIEALPEKERAQPEWIYWFARACVALGRDAEARAWYARIADETHFYGLLAAEEGGRLFAPPPGAMVTIPADAVRADGDPGLRRSLALYRLDMRTEGAREWGWALNGQDEGFLLAAARLALRQGIYDRAIATAERMDPRGSFDLRFIAPYRELVEPQVRRQGLDMAWVYGLMRQESRFIAPARSSSGAQGLMQVMPATGKWVAGKIGLPGYHQGMLTDPDTNVLLGTSYMRLILEGLDNHPVLASAGYNAGPVRARRWRDGRPLEGAIYTETIPFDETRDYVKKVMANAVVYAAMFENRPQSIKRRLGVIAAQVGAE